MNTCSDVYDECPGTSSARRSAVAVPWTKRLFFAAIAVAMPFVPGRAQAAGDGIDLEAILETSGVRGGLVVVAGSGDVEIPADWSDGAPYLVQQLVAGRDRLDPVRTRLRELGVYGRISAIAWDGRALPYADDTVTLLILADEAAGLASGEIERVLAPLGTAVRGGRGESTLARKPWPEDMDHWTHSRYDSTGNAAGADRRVGPPQYTQWVAPPRWNRSVKTSCIVSSDGRIFYILDDAPFSAGDATWALIARDAFSGVFLWRRELPKWIGSFGSKKVGPIQSDRLLVAGGDRIYAPLSEGAPVSILDAAAGDVLMTLESTRAAEEIVLSEGVLAVLANPDWSDNLVRRLRDPKIVLAYDAVTGGELWRHPVRTILPTTMAADDRQIVYHDGRRVVSLDLKTGRPRWTSKPTGQELRYPEEAHPNQRGAEPSVIFVAPQFAPTLILYRDFVAFAGGGQLNVLRADDGDELWRNQEHALSNYSVPADLFGFDGGIWGPDAGVNFWRASGQNLVFNRFDPRTGELQARVEGEYGFPFAHHRCHQIKVSGDNILVGRAGIEFFDTKNGSVKRHHWVRGSCFYGIMPANGAIYVPPHNCACYIRAKLAGFHALRAERTGPPADAVAGERLVRGSAYGMAAADSASGSEDDWPTYRGNAARSGRTGAALRPDPARGWEQRLGGGLTAPVSADGRVFVASAAGHRLFALDVGDGGILWEHTFDGPVDSPPTVHKGLVLGGCRDGSVYALRAEDGAPVWRFRAAPEPLWIVAEERLESVWPVPGAVLVANDLVYFCAGRSSYLDGGLRVFALDPFTGEARVSAVIDSRESDGSQTEDEEGILGSLNDVLSSDGSRLFIRHRALDFEGNPAEDSPAHLHSPDGYLGGDTSSRLLWTWAPQYTSLATGATRDNRLSRTVQLSGQILVEDDDFVYGYGQNLFLQPSPEDAGEWAVFRAPKQQEKIPWGLAMDQYRALAANGNAYVGFNWWRSVSVNVWAMLRSPGALFLAGPVMEGGGGGKAPAAAFVGEGESKLLSLSPDDGRPLFEMDLRGTPVWDGMAAAGGRIFLAMRDGRLVCLDARPGGDGAVVETEGRNDGGE